MIKDKITGRVDIGAFFRIIYQTRRFSAPVTSFELFCNFLENAPEYIVPSGNFLKKEKRKKKETEL